MIWIILQIFSLLYCISTFWVRDYYLHHTCNKFYNNTLCHVNTSLQSFINENEVVFLKGLGQCRFMVYTSLTTHDWPIPDLVPVSPYLYLKRQHEFRQPGYRFAICNKHCFTVYCCLSGLKLPPTFPWSLMLCAVILSCVYFPCSIRERKEQRGTTSHPSWLRSIWLSLETGAETEEMATGLLQKSQVKNDEGFTACGGGKWSTCWHPRVLRNTTKQGRASLI